MARASKPKTRTISDDLLNNALALTHQPIQRCEVTPGYEEYYAPCQSGKRDGHTVTVTQGRVVSDTPACKIDKYILASVGRPALHCIFQLRAAQDIAWLDEVVDFYAAELRPLPELLKNLVRLEIHHQRERIYRSGAMVSQQGFARAA